LARRLGFDEVDSGKVALVVTEAASNLLKHAGRGDIILHGTEQSGSVGLDVLALDQGPGMTDPDRCLRDGFSTAGSPGTGLGAIVRLARDFELHTVAGTGTALRAEVGAALPRAAGGVAGGAANGADRVTLGSVSLPKPGEEVCGDGWAAEVRAGGAALLVVDGLGHGPLAARAAQEALRIFRDNSRLDPCEIFERMHAALRSTRGAAAALAAVDFAAEELRFVGVGNIAATIYADGVSRSAISHNGTLGHGVRKIQEFRYAFPRGATLVMHSDGLATHWRLDQYPGLAVRSPGLIAGVLYRDFKRGRDDVTVAVLRAEAAEPV
jgi:anti-sigma regulatory factor (Ser/Thr protein kinase)